MGELTTGRADVALFPLTLTGLRSHYIDATVVRAWSCGAAPRQGCGGAPRQPPRGRGPVAARRYRCSCVAGDGRAFEREEWPGRAPSAPFAAAARRRPGLLLFRPLPLPQPFMNTGYAILVKVVRLDQAYSFLLPFQTSTWLLILAALVVVVLVLSVLDSWTRAARYRALEEHDGLDRMMRKRRREHAMQYASESIFMLVGQVGPRARGARARLLCPGPRLRVRGRKLQGAPDGSC
jgi:hypothetical protein